MHNYSEHTLQNIRSVFHKEKDFYQIWINFCKQQLNINNIKLKGIEPGKLNEFEGPDFQGSEFEFSGKTYRGDVEIHKDCKDWKRHGHHLDHRYDRVVLHLVASQNTFDVYNSKYQKIPSVSFLEFPIISQNRKCLNKCTITNEMVNSTIFQDLAFQRMLTKSCLISNLVSGFGIDQSLYMLILKALGNVTNKNNYERLSQLVPWKLVHILKANNTSPEFWQALYLGTSGLLDDNSKSILIKHWKNCLPLIEGFPLCRENWKLGGVRPNNLPQNRLTGFALFLWQLNESSIYYALKNLFYKRYPVKNILVELNSLFNTINNKKNRDVNFGKNLIIELTGNVFIPFFYNRAFNKRSYGFQMYLRQLFLELPVTLNYGKLNYFHNHLIKDSPITKFFYYTQALLYLQINYCSSTDTKACPLQTFKQKN